MRQIQLHCRKVVEEHLQPDFTARALVAARRKIDRETNGWAPGLALVSTLAFCAAVVLSRGLPGTGAGAALDPAWTALISVAEQIEFHL